MTSNQPQPHKIVDAELRMARPAAVVPSEVHAASDANPCDQKSHPLVRSAAQHPSANDLKKRELDEQLREDDFCDRLLSAWSELAEAEADEINNLSGDIE